MSTQTLWRGLLGRALRPDFLTLFIWQLGNYAIPLALLPLFSRALGVEGLGIYGVGLAVISTGMMITDWGFLYTSQRALIDCAGDQEKERLVIWETLAARTMLAGACALVILIGALLAGPPYPAVLLAGLPALAANAISLEWLLRARGKFAQFAIGSTLGRFLSIPLALFAVRDPGDAAFALGAVAFGHLAAAAISVALAGKAGLGPAQFPVAASLERIRCGVTLFVSHAATNVYAFATPPLVGVLSTATQVGLFTGADRLRSAARMFFYPITVISFPRISAMRTQHSDELRRYVPRLILIMLICSGSVCAALAIAAPLAVEILLGPEFTEAAPVLRILALGAFVSSMVTLIGANVMVALNMEGAYLRSHLAGVGVGLAAIVLLAGPLGASGAAAGVLLGELVTLAMQIVHLLRFAPWALALVGAGAKQ